MSQIMPVIAGLLLSGCIFEAADRIAPDPVYPEPKFDQILVLFKLVDEVYINGVRVGESTECQGYFCTVELERESYLDCSAHALAHGFAREFHPPQVMTNRQFCKNWRKGR